MRAFPDNDIYLKEPQHIYLSKRYPQYILKSATSFIKRFFPEFNATEKARELAKKEKGKYAQFTNANSILKAWTDKADLGTEVHNQVEKWVGGDRNFPQHPFTQNAVLWLERILDYRKYELWAEQRIGIPQFRLAGTIDLLIRHPEKDAWILVDWKTNETIYTSGFNGKGILPATAGIDDCNYNKYSLQLNLYRWILETYYGLNVMGAYMVHLRKRTATYPLGIKQYQIEYNPYTVHQMINQQLRWIQQGDVFTSKEVESWENLDLTK